MRRLAAAERATASETPEDGVRSEPALIRGTVGLDQRVIEAWLILGLAADRNLGQWPLYVRDRAADPLAAKSIGVAIT